MDIILEMLVLNFKIAHMDILKVDMVFVFKDKIFYN